MTLSEIKFESDKTVHLSTTMRIKAIVVFNSEITVPKWVDNEYVTKIIVRARSSQAFYYGIDCLDSLNCDRWLELAILMDGDLYVTDGSKWYSRVNNSVPLSSDNVLMFLNQRQRAIFLTNLEN